MVNIAWTLITPSSVCCQHNRMVKGDSLWRSDRTYMKCAQHSSTCIFALNCCRLYRCWIVLNCCCICLCNISQSCGSSLLLLFLLAVALMFLSTTQSAFIAPFLSCLSSMCYCYLISAVGYTCVPHSLLEQAAEFNSGCSLGICGLIMNYEPWFEWHRVIIVSFCILRPRLVSWLN